MVDDPYLMLGVARDASSEEVAEAYRALVQIYHPDRYVDAPPRVQAEAHKRMQALNAAYDAVRQSSRPAAAQPPPPPQPPARQAPTPPPPAPSTSAFVHYVDGSRGYHDGNVAPLGFQRRAGQWQPVDGAKRCDKLDDELRAWFDLQQRNASMASAQLYSTWTPQEQALYAAKLGCTQIPREKARSFGVPCGRCGA